MQAKRILNILRKLEGADDFHSMVIERVHDNGDGKSWKVGPFNNDPRFSAFGGTIEQAIKAFARKGFEKPEPDFV